MGNRITKQDLIPGDILLYRGSGVISKAIRRFDGTDYNHVSLYMGEEKVMEAIHPRVDKIDIDTSIESSKSVIVKRLINRPQDMTFVLKKATEFEGERYAYGQLILLAFICTVRGMKLKNSISKFLSKVFEIAASILLKFIPGGKEPMTCSELVYRCYNEVVPDDDNDQYTIHLERTKALIGLQTRSKDLLNSSDSLISQFYGIDGKLFNFNLITPPLIEKNNIIRVDLSLSLLNKERELEDLFADVEKSDKEEYSTRDNKETEILKESLDKFITYFYPVENMNKGFELSDNRNEIVRSSRSVNADFVTPGDLFKARNLKPIGGLK